MGSLTLVSELQEFRKEIHNSGFIIDYLKPSAAKEATPAAMHSNCVVASAARIARCSSKRAILYADSFQNC